MFYREWCLKPNQRRGCMLPLPVLSKFERAPDAGYASVYMFDEAAALEIRDSGSSAGLARFPVYTDTLIMDLDQGDKQLVRARAAITGLAYDVFESGGKGFHIVIPLTQTIGGTNVPYSQRKWVEGLGIEADLSLYHSGHIVSLPGRKHHRTGKRKTRIDTVPGNRLLMPLCGAPITMFGPFTEVSGSLEGGLWRVIALLLNQPAVGGRHTAIWGAAKELAEAGLSYDTVLDIFLEVNKTWHEQKSPEEVQNAVRQAFKQDIRKA